MLLRGRRPVKPAEGTVGDGFPAAGGARPFQLVRRRALRYKWPG